MVLLWVMSIQIAVMLCLDYSVCFYIYMGTAALLLMSKKALKKYLYVFLIAGICTAYFDFLTWPLVTLGIPLTIYICLKRNDSIKGNIQSILGSSVAWGFGYAGMWGMKWLIGSVILRENLVYDAIQEVALRNSNKGITGKTITWMEVLISNLEVILKKPFIILFLTVLVFLAILVVKRRNYVRVKGMIPFAVIMSYPLFWYTFTMNHSYEHFWMTWRICLITIFAFICGIVCICRVNPMEMKDFGNGQES